MSPPLTPRQAEVLAFMRDHADREGMPATLREIGDGLGISSTNGVSDHLKALRNKGYVRAADGRSRGWILNHHNQSRKAPDMKPRDLNRAELRWLESILSLDRDTLINGTVDEVTGLFQLVKAAKIESVTLSVVHTTIPQPEESQ